MIFLLQNNDFMLEYYYILNCYFGLIVMLFLACVIINMKGSKGYERRKKENEERKN